MKSYRHKKNHIIFVIFLFLFGCTTVDEGKNINKDVGTPTKIVNKEFQNVDPSVAKN